ncbi:MAG: 16S rRNA (cytosine(1402)-N(4))-methyltransferase, partial [Burkholderiales bacterium]
ANEIDESTLRLIGRAVRASDAEIAANPRARSVVMRVAERTTREMGTSPRGGRHT